MSSLVRTSPIADKCDLDFCLWRCCWRHPYSSALNHPRPREWPLYLPFIAYLTLHRKSLFASGCFFSRLSSVSPYLARPLGLQCQFRSSLLSFSRYFTSHGLIYTAGGFSDSLPFLLEFTYTGTHDNIWVLIYEIISICLFRVLGAPRIIDFFSELCCERFPSPRRHTRMIRHPMYVGK